MKKIITSLFLLAGLYATAQVKVGDNPTTINASAVLEMESTNKGLLPPRLTTGQRDAISNPAKGLAIFNTTSNSLEVNTGTPASPVWSSAKSGDVNNTTLTSSTSPAGTSLGQMMYNTGSVQPTGLVYWDGTQWRSVASSGGDTTNNYPVTNNSAVTNNSTVTNNNPVTNNSTSTFNGVSTFNDQAVFNDTAVFNNGMKVGNLPQGAVTDSLMVFEPNTKEVRRLSIAGAAAAGEPWYKVGTTAGATANTDNVYLNGSVGIGTNAPATTLHVSSTGTYGINIERTAAAGAAPRLHFYKNNGTAIGSPTAVTNGSTLGAIDFYAHNGTSYPNVGAANASILSYATEDQTASAKGTNLAFRTNPNGSASSAERMRIDQNGNVGIGTTTPNASALLDITSTGKGFLPPRMTSTDRDAIVNPAKGLMIFNTTTNAQETNTGTPATPVWSSAATISAAGEPWYKVGTTSAATANTDSVYLNGNVGIGTNSPIAPLHVATTGVSGMAVERTAAAAAPVRFGLYKNNGTAIGSPAAVTNGSVIGQFGFYAHNGTSYPSISNPNASIISNATEDHSGTNGGTNLTFNTVANGSIVAAERMRIENNGNVGIGTSNPGGKLHIAGDATGAGWYNSAIFSSHTGTGGHTWAFGARAVSTPGDFSISDETDGAIRMTIHGTTGRVSIASQDYGSRLNMGGTTASTTASYDPFVTLAASDGPIGTLYHSYNGSKSYIGLQSFTAGDTEKTPIVFGEWGGTVGIGINTPTAKLHVDGDAKFTNLNTNAGLQINANANRTYLQYLGTAGSNTALVLTGRGGGNEDITINGATGYVGILNGAPKAPLHIGGTTASSFSTGAYTYFDFSFANGSGVTRVASSSSNTSASIIAEGNIWSKLAIVSTQSMTFSDSRIKNIIGQSDATKDLDLLNKIRITDYRMKDVVMQGNKQYKKVIAQEVEAIYPEAVTTQTGFVPNIYQLADNVVSLGNNTYKANFKNKVEYNTNVTGDLKLYDEQKEITAKVVSKADNEIVFTTAEEMKGDKLFLFGEEVTDFRAVDYEALSTLNISATQELYREIQALKKQNAVLTAQVGDTKKLETAYAELAAQVKAMQEVLNMPKVQDGTVAERR